MSKKSKLELHRESGQSTPQLQRWSYTANQVNKRLNSEELDYVMTASEAVDMNKQDRHASYKAGDRTRRFLSEEHVVRRAKERAAEIFPNGFKLKVREHM